MRMKKKIHYQNRRQKRAEKNLNRERMYAISASTMPNENGKGKDKSLLTSCDCYASLFAWHLLLSMNTVGSPETLSTITCSRGILVTFIVSEVVYYRS
jgi:hypothetical protein